MASNTIRFSGLSSGMDTESIVKALLTREQNKIDGEKRKQTSLNWRKDAWKEMNTKISTFNTKYVDKLRLASTYAKTTAMVSNEAALSITAAGTMPEGTHEVSDIKLAKTAYVTSNPITTNDGSQLTSETTLSQLGITSNAIFKLNDQTITVNPGDTVASLEAQMKAADSNLSVNFDVNNQRIFITSKKATVNIKLEDPDGVLANLKLTAGVTPSTPASCKYNGQTITSDNNVINVNGFTMTLKQEGTGTVYISSKKDTEGTVKLVKEFVDEYNKLIEDINTKLDTKKSRTYIPLTDAQKEKMSDKEIEKWEDKAKESLFYRDSNLAEVRDMLRNQLGGLVNGSSTYKILADIGIRTGTTADAWKENGKLYVDEDKLVKALESNPDQVINLLTGPGDEAAAAAAATAAGETYSDLSYRDKRKWLASTNTEGIFARISYQLGELSRSSDLRSFGSFYNDKVDTDEAKEVADNILEYQEKYTAKEKALYAKFTAMEKAMSKMNSQQSSLTSILGQS